MMVRLPLLALVAGQALLLPASATYTTCTGETHIKDGNCNAPTSPCKAGTGYTNVFKQPTLQACEAKCDTALPKGNCAGVTWHDAHAGAWANVCVLETADAWAGFVGHAANHVSACNGLAPCKCSTKPSPPGPPPPPHPADAAGCVVKQAALAYSQKALVPPRHADRIAAALDLSGCPKVESTPSTAALPHLPLKVPKRGRNGGANFWVDAAKGSDSAAGTSAAAAFKTLHKAQDAARGATGATVHLLPGATHRLAQTLTLTPQDSHVSWVGAGPDVVVSGAQSFSTICAGKWKQQTKPQIAANSGNGTTFSCQLPVGTSFDSLFLNGLRQKKARFPNGDPLAVKDGYDKGCHPVDWWNISGIQEHPTNVHMVSKSGAKISQGSIFPATPGSNVTVVIEDREAPREGETTGNNPSYYGTRFNET